MMQLNQMKKSSSNNINNIILGIVAVVTVVISIFTCFMLVSTSITGTIICTNKSDNSFVDRVNYYRDYLTAWQFVDIPVNELASEVDTASSNYIEEFGGANELSADIHTEYDYVVVLDAGHGGDVTGMVVDDIAEKDLNLAIVMQLKELLEADDNNILVLYTRMDDTNPSFRERVDLAQKADADLFLSIHMNSTDSGRSSGINGTCAYYKATDETKRSMDFAGNCLRHLLGDLGSENKGLIVGDDIYVVRENICPAALIELGYMTNPGELERLTSKEYQQKAANALYIAILEELGL